ncbi:hypothetical protein BDV98DRAFT_159253 [Pterulicium gracile]|uniref:Uncharacterized protein n=1 Tax=Pterulicium gracile TaxID=1884261 RepID=A0A5C3QZ70_9AGAR|nr:hypothetical protein BDV98DRAFT_159253 [Pterula gracilis]
MSTNAQDTVVHNSQEVGQDVFLPVEPRDLRRSSTPLTPFSFVSDNSEEPVLSPAAAKMFQHITSDEGVSDMEVKEQRKLMKEARRSSLDCSSPSLGSFPDAGPSASSLANEWHRSGTSAYNIPNPLASANAPKRSRSMRPQDMNRLPSSRPTEPLPNLERHQSGRLSRKSSTRTISSSTTLTKDGFERPPSHKSRTKVNRISTLLKSKNRATTDDEGYASSSTAAIEGRRGHRSKRSLSLWSGEGILNSFDNAQGSAAQELQDRYHSQFGSEPVSRMTEKERVEHLRRTRKLVQLFGHEPPKELLHTHRSRERCDSISTINSLASTNLLNMKPSGPRSSESEENAQPVDAKPFAVVSDIHLADVNPEHQLGAFHERRKRVVKLSRFFGVAAHDIELPMPDTMPKPKGLSTEVKVHEHGHFWSAGDQWTDGNDLDDLRHRLRDLKAA